MEEPEFHSLLGRWGFNSSLINPHNPWSNPNLGVSKEVISFLEDYLQKFPSSQNMLLSGAPRKTHYILSNLFYRLFLADKLHHKISLIDIPTLIVDQFHRGSELDQREQIDDISTQIHSSDIVVFQEIALNNWTPNQQTRIYALINKRYQLQKPTIFTSSKTIDETADALIEPTYYRIEENCTYIDLTV